MLAAYNRKTEIALALLKENEQFIKSRNVLGETAVHYAIDSGQINVIDFSHQKWDTMVLRILFKIVFILLVKTC